MRAALQLALDIETPQWRPRRRESPKLYAAILAFRARGWSVRRCGAQHLVAGRQVTTRELMRLAKAAHHQMASTRGAAAAAA